MDHEFNRRSDPDDDAQGAGGGERPDAQARARDEQRAEVWRRATAPAPAQWRGGAAPDAVVDAPAQRVADANAAQTAADIASPIDGPFSLAARLRSFGFAVEGVRHLIATQPNAWIHSVATVGVVAVGLGVGLGRIEWAIIALTIAVVWFAEAMNTAFEHLCDVVQPEFHPSVKRAKDIAAGAVLLASICATVTGLLIFVPYLWALIGG